MGLGLAPGYTFFTDSSIPAEHQRAHDLRLQPEGLLHGERRTRPSATSQGGPLITVPLKFIPPAYGNWALKAGVQFLVLNSNLEAVNTGDSFVPIGSVGVAMTY